MMILDGGLGQALVSVAGKATDLWSIQALIDDPQSISAVHDAFFAAGSEIATTNTYALIPDRLAQKGLGARFSELVELACTLACESRDKHGAGLVAGSLGPQGFSYQPQLCPPPEQAAEVYKKHCAHMEPFVDIYLLETMSSYEQALGGLMATQTFDKLVWVALSVDDDNGQTLRSGETLMSVVPKLIAYQPDAMLLNCSRPEAITEGLPHLQDALYGTDIKVGAYANAFRRIHPKFNSINATVDLLDERTDLEPGGYLRHAQEWADLGVELIGGCCGIGPSHIEVLANYFRNKPSSACGT